ncbi:aluminum-activated malate transporter 8-like [Lycium barbarum]|uniref:aluminum-activated malate transporter 8-like n=1 Tax=Lycium barbarum TaxID=112863 RepID=UPI00293E5A95|nr:aluminum-activated malate transporter 8-like [Lycium barbarum]
MDIDSTNQENVGVFTKWCNKLNDFPRKSKKKVGEIAKNTKQIGSDDPRKVWHAFKVGLALSLVSLFYYTNPLFDNFDQPAMWAILTVVVVFEFSAGATISKSINRGFGTALAGALGLGAKYLAELIGKERPDPVVLEVLVFIVGVLGTFTRFYPHIKRRYDYGTMIFVLTFSLVAVSSYRTEDLFQLAHRRISTILIGVSTVMIISMFIRPVWAGDDLHKLGSTNLEKLASFLEGFGSAYFHNSEIESTEGTRNNEKGFLEGCSSVLGSKANEESLAKLAWWEPPHGYFRLGYPWKLYLKIGGRVRKCASHLRALSGHLNSRSQSPTEFERKTEEACKRMITESSKALKELALSIETMTQPFYCIIHIRNARNAIDDLKQTLGTSKIFFRHDESRVMDFFPSASVVSILVDVVKCIDEIYEAVEELSVKARFVRPRRRERRRRDLCSTEAAVERSPPPPPRSRGSQILHRGIVNPIMEDDDLEGDDFVTIEIGDNVESRERVVVEEEEENRVNNPINASKGECVVIGIRGSTKTAIVEEKKGEFTNLADIKFYDSNTQILKSALVTATAIVEETKLGDSTLFFEPNAIGVKYAGRRGLSEIEYCK